MIAIDGNLYPSLSRCRPDQRSRRYSNGNIVYGQVYKFVFFLFWHIFFTVLGIVQAFFLLGDGEKKETPLHFFGGGTGMEGLGTGQ